MPDYSPMRYMQLFSIPVLVLINLIVLSSCQESYPKEKKNDINSDSTIFKSNQNKVPLPDTTQFVIPDDYAITNKMLEKKYYINGKSFSEEFVWFTNDTLNQSLIFELYTDYHRLSVTHILNNDIPEALFEKVLHATESDYKQANKGSITLKIKSADKINSRYFISEKGFQLGDMKQNAIKIYSQPDTIIKFNDSEMYSWDFFGDSLPPEEKRNSNKPFAKESFGYHVKMFFRNNRLIAMTLHNEIP